MTILSALLFSLVSQAAFPPTTSKIDGDSAPKTTFNYLFPNFSGSHNGTSVTLSVNSVAGGGTGQSSYTNGQILIGNTTGNTLAKGTITAGSNITITNGAGAITLDAVLDDPSELNNLGIAASVGSSAITVALKQKDGSTNPSSGSSSVKISFRNSTVTTGGYTERSVTGALSVVVSSGSTLGSASGSANWIYVYAIDNAGTVELAVAGSNFVDCGSVVTTTAEGGAGAADSKSTLYSTSARSNVSCRLIGRVKSTQATAGTWATSPSEVSVYPFEVNKSRSMIRMFTANAYGGSSSGETTVRNFTTVNTSIGTAITYTARTTTTGDKFTINEDGVYCMIYSDNWTAAQNFAITINSSGLSTNPNAITPSQELAISHQGSANTYLTISGCMLLAAGDVVRAQAGGTAAVDGNYTSFTIVKAEL